MQINIPLNSQQHHQQQQKHHQHEQEQQHEQQQKLDILNQYKPIIYFDSHEQYYPSTIEYYLANAEGFDYKDSLIYSIGEINSNNIHQVYNKHLLQFKLKNKTALNGFQQESDIVSCPFYGTVIDNIKLNEIKDDGLIKILNPNQDASSILLRYSFFYPARGPLYLFRFIPICLPTEVDVVHIDIYIDRYTKELQYIYFPILDIKVPKENLEFQDSQDSHVKLYASLYDHYLYPKKQLNDRRWTCFYEKADGKGLIWSPSCIEYVDSSIIWNSFGGNIGSKRTPLINLN